MGNFESRRTRPTAVPEGNDEALGQIRFLLARIRSSFESSRYRSVLFRRPQPQAGFVEARGALETTAKDRLQRVAQYYREFLKREGDEASENSTTTEAGAMTFLSGRKEAEGKTLAVVCTESQEGTHIFLSSDESEDPKQP